MNHRRVVVLALIAVFLATVVVGNAAAVARTPTFAADPSYAQYIEEKLVGFGTWPGYGFRAAGSVADNQAAAFLKTEMKKIGLSNVRLEPVPVDAWDFAGASLTATWPGGGATYVASSMGGVVGTPSGGLSGDIVYVGRGTPGEYPAGGVAGKLLLVDWDADWFWVNLIGHQATEAGAKGLIVSTMNHPSYYRSPDSIGSFDATYDDAWIPLITISRNAGFELMGHMAAGTVRGTMVSKVTMTLAEDGGTGYNVIGVLPGADHEHPILILGHHDAWFTGASDDTSSMAAMLAWAKALVVSGYTPAHDLYFIGTTGEEYGNTDAYYEWLVGAWYMITQAHPDWGARATAFLNLEGLGGIALDRSIGPFAAVANLQLAPLIRGVFGANPTLLPYGWIVETGVNSWTDAFTLAAAGIPGATFGTVIAGYDDVYHTNEDDLRFVDYPEMVREIAAMQKVLQSVDQAAILPYRFSERAFDLARSVDPKDYAYLGVDVSGLTAQISTFRSLAAKYDRMAGSLPASIAAQANALLRQASVLVNREWTALSCWDATIYPTQQVEWDATWLKEALGFLTGGKIDAALDELWNVGLTWNAFFDYTVWKWENDRHAPDAEHLNWGAQGHLAPYVDIYDAYVSLLEKADSSHRIDVSWESAALTAVLTAELEELSDRVMLETQQVAAVNAILGQLVGMAA